MYLNVARAPFSDGNVRKAMQLAIDLDAMNQTMTGGVTETPRGFFPASYPYSDPTLVFPNPDVDKAQKLVDPYIAANGEINFTYTVSNSPLSTQRAQIMKQQVERLKGVFYASTGLVIDSLARPEWVVEIDATAVIPE